MAEPMIETLKDAYKDNQMPSSACSLYPVTSCQDGSPRSRAPSPSRRERKSRRSRSIGSRHSHAARGKAGHGLQGPLRRSALTEERGSDEDHHEHRLHPGRGARLLGRPDVKPMQEEMLREVQKRLSANLKAMDAEAMLNMSLRRRSKGSSSWKRCFSRRWRRARNRRSDRGT